MINNIIITLLILILLSLYLIFIKEHYTSTTRNNNSIYHLNDEAKAHDKWINDYINYYDTKYQDVTTNINIIINNIKNLDHNLFSLHKFFKGTTLAFPTSTISSSADSDSSGINENELNLYYLNDHNLMKLSNRLNKNSSAGNLSNIYNFKLIKTINNYFKDKYLNSIAIANDNKYVNHINNYLKYTSEYYTKIINKIADNSVDDNYKDIEQNAYESVIKSQSNTNIKHYIERINVFNNDLDTNTYYTNSNNYFNISLYFIKILLEFRKISNSQSNGPNYKYKYINDTNTCNIKFNENIIKSDATTQADTNTECTYILKSDIYINNDNIKTNFEALEKILIKIVYKIEININGNDKIKKNSLPCVLYDASSCPSYGSTDDNIGKRCNSNLEKNICYPTSTDYNVPIEKCEALSMYGKEVCENTENTDKKQCVFNNLLNKCSDTEKDNTNINCNEIDVSIQDNINKCMNHKESSSGNSCKYIYKKVGNGKDLYRNVCYNENNTTQKSEANKSIKDIINDIEKCSEITSDNLKINDKDILQNICNNKDTNETDSNSYGKCIFLEYPTYIDGKNFTKCISPSQLEQKSRESNIINVLNTSNTHTDSGILSVKSNLNSKYCHSNNKDNMCIDDNPQCNNRMYKNICDNNKNCFWHSANFSDADNSNGYCLNSDSKEIYQNMKDILMQHNKEIRLNELSNMYLNDISDNLNQSNNTFTKNIGSINSNV